jgi:hypothetical protein
MAEPDKKRKRGWWNPLSDLFDSASNVADSAADEFIASVPHFDSGSDQSFEGKNVRCFLCGRPVAVKLTKKKRPYWQCRDCWVQVFIRGDSGIKRLQKWLEAPRRTHL